MFVCGGGWRGGGYVFVCGRLSVSRCIVGRCHVTSGTVTDSSSVASFKFALKTRQRHLGLRRLCELILTSARS